jgi:DNA polymerase/3'-5' exonuclease PolX
LRFARHMWAIGSKSVANQVYDMELCGESQQRVWAYRKAAWAIEDTPQDLGLIYRQMGVKGLEGIENVSPKLAQVVEALIRQWP